MAVVTLITDFGCRDHYVASVKGVVLSISPQTVIVDVTHKVERHNVLHAAFVLRETVPWYPDGTVHLAVVDPGVGTDRRIIAARCGRHFVVAPDNGLVTLLHRHMRLEAVRVVQNPQLATAEVSATFHARDLMAPAVAHLAAGGRFAELGPATDHLEVLQISEAVATGDASLKGQVIYVDAFGNLISNIGAEDALSLVSRRPDTRVYVSGRCVGPLRHSYADAPVQEPLAVIGSSRLLEVAVNRDSAARRFDAGVGTDIELH